MNYRRIIGALILTVLTCGMGTMLIIAGHLLFKYIPTNWLIPMGAGTGITGLFIYFYQVWD